MSVITKINAGGVNYDINDTRAVTEVAFDATNKKITKSVNGGTATDVVSFVSGGDVSITGSGTQLTISCTNTNDNQTVKGNGTAFGANDAVDIVGASGIKTTADTTNKKITVEHTNSVTAGTASEGGSARTLAYGGSFNVPSVTYDAQGHITAKGSTQLTLPASDEHNQTVKAGSVAFGADDVVGFVAGGAATVVGDATAKTITITAPADTNQKVKAGDVTFEANDVVGFVGGAGLSVTGDASADTITIAHSNSVTAGTAGTTSAQTPSYGATFNIPYVTYDAQGHITASGNSTVKIPASDNTNQTVKVGSNTFGANAAVEFVAGGDASVSADTTNNKITVSATNTKNTAGTTNNAATKMYVVGATEQSANPQTYSNANVYIGTDNELYANGKKLAHYEDVAKAVVFRGTLGTGGTITTLPTASADTEGDMYKVITAGTYDSKTAKVGDLFVCRACGTSPETYEWVLIPSGDEPSGTVTNVATGSGLTGGPITTSGTISLATAYGDTVNPYSSKTANTVLAAPNGSAGTPSFRALLASDISDLSTETLTASTTELNYVTGVTSAIQTQLNAKNKKGYATTITGDGSSTSFTVTHSLGTQDVIVQVYDLSTYSTVVTEVTRTSTSVVTVEFNTAPTSSSTYRVLVIPIA